MTHATPEELDADDAVVDRLGGRTPDFVELTEAEAQFRAMAFRIAYNDLRTHVNDLATRFAYAIAHSARKMMDRNLFEIWWAWTRGRSITSLLQSRSEPPAELRPFVESYLGATRERARETGDPVEDLI